LKIVITGGSGKLAEYLAPKLAQEHAVVLYDKQHPQHNQFLYVQGEITDRAKLGEAFRGADVVIHLAALREWTSGSINKKFPGSLK
jgi:nucleoside-diphosphate-sugar epimerase